jgi:hypothetical protein
MTINHYRDYCENEYCFVKNSIACNNLTGVYAPKEIADNAIQRLLGAGYLAMRMGVPYAEIERELNFYKEKIKEVCETH